MKNFKKLILLASASFSLGLSLNLPHSMANEPLPKSPELQTASSVSFPAEVPPLPSVITPQILEGIRQAKSEFDLVMLKKVFRGVERLVILVAHRSPYGTTETTYQDVTALQSLFRGRKYDVQREMITEPEYETATPESGFWRSLRSVKKVYDFLDNVNNILRAFHPLPTHLQMRILGFVVFSDATLYWALQRFGGDRVTRFMIPQIRTFWWFLRGVGYAYGIYAISESYLKPYHGDKAWYKRIFVMSAMSIEKDTKEIVSRIDSSLEKKKANVIVIPIEHKFYEEATRRLIKEKNFERVELPAFF